MMRCYAGMIENALVQAETRAKQVGAALARDTAGQAQQALAQIERLREEAQAHTARAVGDLKGSFETVITQIGRQLEQMRGQFDNTSRGMRETARQTATDLDSMRQEMQRRMEALPQQTAQATAAIRKALVRPVERDRGDHARAQPGKRRLSRQRGGALSAAALPSRGQSLPPQRRATSGPSDYDLPPLPRFDAQGRQDERRPAGDRRSRLGGEHLAQQLSGASQFDRRGGGDGFRAQASGQLDGGSRGRARAMVLGRSSGARLGARSAAILRRAPPRQEQGFGTRGPVGAPNGAGQGLRLDEIARAIDHRTAAEVWQRFRVRRARRARTASLQPRRSGDLRRDQPPLRSRRRLPRHGRSLYEGLRAAAGRGRAGRPARAACCRTT